MPTAADIAADRRSRRLLEWQLRELTGRLVHAHEQERIRIARELHDGVAQGLAVLALDLRRLAEEREDGEVDIRNELGQVSMRVAELGAELHRVSHELHPALLEQLGLEAAIRAYGTELSKVRRLDVEFQVGAVPDQLPADIALCLYRVTQEALNNVVRHSGAQSATVSLAAVHDEIALAVTDSGLGFDQRSAGAKATLGLKSMRERVRLVNGHIRVDSIEGQGTCIDVRVPLLDVEP